jgi:hypothetical protein
MFCVKLQVLLKVSLVFSLCWNTATVFSARKTDVFYFLGPSIWLQRWRPSYRSRLQSSPFRVHWLDALTFISMIAHQFRHLGLNGFTLLIGRMIPNDWSSCSTYIYLKNSLIIHTQNIYNLSTHSHLSEENLKIPLARNRSKKLQV